MTSFMDEVRSLELRAVGESKVSTRMEVDIELVVKMAQGLLAINKALNYDLPDNDKMAIGYMLAVKNIEKAISEATRDDK